MTTTSENPTDKPKQVPDFYIFENVGNGEKGGKPAGGAFVHKKGKGFTLLIGGKRCPSNRHRERARERSLLPLTADMERSHEHRTPHRNL